MIVIGSKAIFCCAFGIFFGLGSIAQTERLRGKHMKTLYTDIWYNTDSAWHFEKLHDTDMYTFSIMILLGIARVRRYEKTKKHVDS